MLGPSDIKVANSFWVKSAATGLLSVRLPDSVEFQLINC
jgi:hypothetical protein